MLPNSTERLVTVSGSVDAVTRGILQICNVMLEASFLLTYWQQSLELVSVNKILTINIDRHWRQLGVSSARETKFVNQGRNEKFVWGYNILGSYKT